MKRDLRQHVHKLNLRRIRGRGRNIDVNDGLVRSGRCRGNGLWSCSRVRCHRRRRACWLRWDRRRRARWTCRVRWSQLGRQWLGVAWLGVGWGRWTWKGVGWSRPLGHRRRGLRCSMHPPPSLDCVVHLSGCTSIQRLIMIEPQPKPKIELH